MAEYPGIKEQKESVNQILEVLKKVVLAKNVKLGKEIILVLQDYMNGLKVNQVDRINVNIVERLKKIRD